MAFFAVKNEKGEGTFATRIGDSKHEYKNVVKKSFVCYIIICIFMLFLLLVSIILFEKGKGESCDTLFICDTGQYT